MKPDDDGSRQRNVLSNLGPWSTVLSSGKVAGKVLTVDLFVHVAKLLI